MRNFILKNLVLKVKVKFNAFTFLQNCVDVPGFFDDNGCSWYVIDVETNQAMCNNYLFVIALPLVLFIAYTMRRDVTTGDVTTLHCVAGM